jgi:hypothetical protein
VGRGSDREKNGRIKVSCQFLSLHLVVVFTLLFSLCSIDLVHTSLWSSIWSNAHVVQNGIPL